MTPSKTPVSEVEAPWLLSRERNGAWSAVINLRGEWLPLGYFGAREDAEETIAACLYRTPKLHGHGAAGTS